MHSKAKQTEMSEFEAEKDLLQGRAKENRQFVVKKKQTNKPQAQLNLRLYF